MGSDDGHLGPLYKVLNSHSPRGKVVVLKPYSARPAREDISFPRPGFFLDPPRVLGVVIAKGEPACPVVSLVERAFDDQEYALLRYEPIYGGPW